jgi:hypothetical protein
MYENIDTILISVLCYYQYYATISITIDTMLLSVLRYYQYYATINIMLISVVW